MHTPLKATLSFPQLQPTVLAIPLSGGRLALHRGTRQSAPSVVLNDATGWKYQALRWMDGNHAIEAILDKLAKAGKSVEQGTFLAFLNELAALSALHDHTFFDHSALRPDQAERYSRNLNGFAALVTDPPPAMAQRALLQGHVLMLGVGGLGSCTATALAMAGCGTITAVDFDHIELSNLNRQLFTAADIGARKVDKIKEHLAQHNPDVTVNIHCQRLDGKPAIAELLQRTQPHIVIAAIDRPTIAADHWISDACFDAGVPALFNSVSAGQGLLWSKVPGQTGCFQCDELWSEDKTPEHYQIRRHREAHDLIPATSAFSYSAMTVAGMMTADIIRCLLGMPMASAGKLVVIDFATLTTTVTDKPRHPDCPICAHRFIH